MNEIKGVMKEAINHQIRNKQSHMYVITPGEIAKIHEYAQEHGNIFLELTETGLGPIIRIAKQGTKEYVDVTNYDSF